MLSKSRAGASLSVVGMRFGDYIHIRFPLAVAYLEWPRAIACVHFEVILFFIEVINTRYSLFGLIGLKVGALRSLPPSASGVVQNAIGLSPSKLPPYCSRAH